MGRCVIVANQTLGGRELEVEIADRIGRGTRRFLVVVPLTDPAVETMAWLPYDPMFGVPVPVPPDEDALARARERCEQRLQAMVDKVTRLGGEASGELGDPDPVRAVEDVLAREEVDEVIVSTLPAGLSRWIGMDVVSRIERLADCPVNGVEAAANQGRDDG